MESITGLMKLLLAASRSPITVLSVIVGAIILGFILTKFGKKAQDKTDAEPATEGHDQVHTGTAPNPEP